MLKKMKNNGGGGGQDAPMLDAVGHGEATRQ